MPKITFIGAGSTVFAKNLMGDIMQFPELAHATISLHDIDEKRLKESTAVCHNVAKLLNATPTIEATTDRRVALDGADYVISMIQVGGYDPCTITDFDIPKKYGLRQTIGDTLGIGGIMRGLRTIPVLLDVCHDMEHLCTEALLLNYVNPMAMNTWAINLATSIKTVGLCHSVPHTAHELATDIGVPVEEIDYLVAGINHMAFYLKFERKGQDLYPLIEQVNNEGRVPDWNRVRYDMFKRLGYFVTESSEHFSEYVPWFIKQHRPDLLDTYNIPLDEYIARCKMQIRAWEFMQATKGDISEADLAGLQTELQQYAVMPQSMAWSLETIRTMHEVKPSVEYGSLIIHSMETGIPRTIYGNVMNEGLIDNLPYCCVELPCLVDKNGIQPTRVGALPPQLAALMQTNINVQNLTVSAALTGKREHIYHAAMLDPHTSAELDLDQIWSMVDALIEAHGDWLPEYH